ncbi:MAG: hypothetical protein HWE10_03300 [Gammaproteobacteria bacterium]|nr:hypothetical protein [Gammaproteobacteria bacterium]
MIKNKLILLIWLVALFSNGSSAMNPNIDYIVNGDVIKPWRLQLEFGKKVYNNNKVSTLRRSLTVEPIAVSKDAKAVRLNWQPKGIANEWGAVNKNILTATLVNSKKMIDLSTVVDRAALTLELKVNRSPQENVDLMMECGRNWQCRSRFPLKNVLKSLPENQWSIIPIPLKCLVQDGFDMSKISSIFGLQTEGKLDIEIANIQLTSLPEGNINCG